MSITTIRRPAAAGRRALGARLAAAVRYVATGPAAAPKRRPAVTVATPTAPTGQAPTETFATDEIPALSDIAAAAEKYMAAAEQARTAGRYGAWDVEYVENARETADLDAIRAVFAAHGLGEVPMRPCAASLKVAIAADAAQVATLAAA